MAVEGIKIKKEFYLEKMGFLKFRNFVCCILFIAFLFVGNTGAFAGDDRFKHFAVSSLFGAASESYLHYKTDLNTSGRIIWGVVLGSIPGLTKELIDSTKKENHFSGLDLAADVAGAFVGAVAANLFNNVIQIKVEKTKENKAIIFSFSYKF